MDLDDRWTGTRTQNCGRQELGYLLRYKIRILNLLRYRSLAKASVTTRCQPANSLQHLRSTPIIWTNKIKVIYNYCPVLGLNGQLSRLLSIHQILEEVYPSLEFHWRGLHQPGHLLPFPSGIRGEGLDAQDLQGWRP